MPTTPARTQMMIERLQVSLEDTFNYRVGPDSAAHLSALRKTLRNTGRLDPILVWQEVDNEGTLTGRLVLLDGRYRLAAYRAEQSAGNIVTQNIPAILLKSDLMEAHLAALSANARDVVPLTPVERTNAAWALVRTFWAKLSKRRLALASGVSQRTIARMRQQYRKFPEAKETPSGNWTSDRKFPEENSWEPPTDAERADMIERLVVALQGALNEIRTKDVEIIGDALQRALGNRQFSLVVDYLGAGDCDDDGGTGWLDPDEFEGELDTTVLKDPFMGPQSASVRPH